MVAGGFILVLSQIYLFTFASSNDENLNSIGNTVWLEAENISITLLSVQSEVEIRNEYFFGTPQVNIDCNISSFQNCQSGMYGNTICIQLSQCPRNSNSSTISYNCLIRVKPSSYSKTRKAFKLNRNSKITFHELKIFNGAKTFTLKIPSEMKRVIINDELTISIDQSNQVYDPLLDYDWYFVENGFNDLKTRVDINEVNEWNLLKLGWFKQNQIDGDFVCKTSELMNNFHTNYDCSNFKLNAVDYFNSNGILQQEVAATNLEQLTDNIVSDVDINFNTSILVVSYENILSRFLHLSVARPVDFLSFSAQLRVDKFANRLLTFELNDFLIGQVIIEIGIPSSSLPIHSHTIHHNGRPKIYKLRFSATIGGDQWICAYPLKNASRITCRFVEYTDEVFQGPEIEEKYFIKKHYDDDNSTTTILTLIPTKRTEMIGVHIILTITLFSMLLLLLLIVQLLHAVINRIKRKPKDHREVRKLLRTQQKLGNKI
uniref:Uncharacterized protein n=1 Tax=Strigamia maritima TaxID=126957 RepID=T1JBS4_STRMM